MRSSGAEGNRHTLSSLFQPYYVTFNLTLPLIDYSFRLFRRRMTNIGPREFSRLSLPPESELERTLKASDFDMETRPAEQQQKPFQSELKAAYQHVCALNTRLRDRLEVYERVSDLLIISHSAAAPEPFEPLADLQPATARKMSRSTNFARGGEPQHYDEAITDAAILGPGTASVYNRELNRTSSPIPPSEAESQSTSRERRASRGLLDAGADAPLALAGFPKRTKATGSLAGARSMMMMTTTTSTARYSAGASTGHGSNSSTNSEASETSALDLFDPPGKQLKDHCT